MVTKGRGEELDTIQDVLKRELKFLEDCYKNERDELYDDRADRTYNEIVKVEEALKFVEELREEYE